MYFYKKNIMAIDIKDIKLFFIDNEKKECEPANNISLDNINFKDFVERTISNIIDIDNDKKQYILDSNKSNVSNLISELKENSDYYNTDVYNDSLLKESKRLLSIEIETIQKISGLKSTLQKGSILYILLKNDEADILLICKIEHDEILREDTFDLVKGLNNKKTIYKSFLYYLNTDLIYVSDKNNSKYWFQNFLELENINSDKENTSKSLDYFIKEIDKFKNKAQYKYESIIIRNNILIYFRSNENFNFSEFMKTIFSYAPIYNFPLDELKKKFTRYPKNLDKSFTIDKEETKKKRFINKIDLGRGLSLNIDGTINDITNIIMPYSKDGENGITIITEAGFNWVNKTDD